MAFYKVTFFFESEQAPPAWGTGSSLGWTETSYLEDPGSLDAAFASPDVQNYITLRRAFLANIYNMTFVRISLEGSPRVFKIFNVVGGVGAATWRSGQPHRLGQVQCAILVDATKLPINSLDKSHHRRMLLRGLPTDLIDGNVIDSSGNNWPKVLTFLNFLFTKPAGGVHPAGNPQSAKLGIRYYDPSIQAVTVRKMESFGAALKQIRVEPDVPEWILFTANPTRVVVTNVKDEPRLNRTWKFIARDGTAPNIGMVFGQLTRPFYGGYINEDVPDVRMRRAAFLYSVPEEYTIIGLRNKKTGRVFRGLRGRSSKRR